MAGKAVRKATEEELEQLRDLHGQGISRNRIAQIMNTYPQRITALAQEMGLIFKRSEQMVQATEADKDDARARRAKLALALLGDAAKLREQLWQKCIAYNFGGRDNTYSEHELDKPGFRDQYYISQAVAVLVDRAVRLDEYDSGAGLGQVVSLLESMGKGLNLKFGTGDTEHPDATKGATP